VSDLGSQRWRDRASSLRVVEGRWEVCRNPDFQWCVQVDAPIDDLVYMGWNDDIASVRPVDQ